MHAGRIRKFFLALLLVTAAPAYAANPSGLFEDGNRLFREDLYWAALLRYQQALDSGLDTPQLHYNMGVAHFKAEQHIRARESFLKAARYSRLRVVSQYNLGLNAWAAGNYVEANDWFTQARTQNENPRIATMAKRALSLIAVEIQGDEPLVLRAEAEEKRKDITTFDLRASLGGGMDSNVFRSTSEAYVDLADPNLPLITPVVQEGFYIPASLKAKYSVHSFENESFFGAYRLAGRYYQDKALTNGNEYQHELSFGTEYEKRKETSKRQIYSAFTVAQHDEVYYDRDTGSSRTVDDVDISDRFNYYRYGPEIWFRQSFDRFSFAARGKAQIWNYENTEEVPEYDHEYFLVGLNTQYRFTRTSLIRLTADAYQRKFGDRPSFELDGTQPIGVPPVQYNYLELGVTARQRVTKGFWFSLDYVHTEREDGYVGYNNYVKNSYGGEIHLDLGQRFNIEASGAYQIYDYENAFAFQNPAAGPKTLERAFGRVVANFLLTPNITILTEYRYEDAVSNDTRIAYNRNQLSIGVRWENR